MEGWGKEGERRRGEKHWHMPRKARKEIGKFERKPALFPKPKEICGS